MLWQQFIYNRQRQLAIKTANSKPIQFVYDEAGHLLAEHADPATQSPSQDHLWLGDTPIAVVRPNSSDPSKPLIYHVYADHLNTPRAIYDAFNKRLTWRWESEAFGNTLPDQDADKNGSQFVYHLRFPGQYWDNGIKLSHNWYRTYNPETGRYVQSDPIGLQGGLNTYAYALSSPLLKIDPMGLETAEGPEGPYSTDPRAHFPLPPGPPPKGRKYWEPVCDAAEKEYGKWMKPLCKACVRYVCEDTMARPACCAVRKDKCMGEKDPDDQNGQQQCLTDFALCSGRLKQ
ncbi:RHS repeat-associated core domain-containing protein [Chitinivorax sp. B]|uniref:RHS repeat domain-containing protein n=1 Tax=Chitinivorax sp. B TaxID=2502235 RepID=UPI0014850AEA|nr:RHS repeat-associated core domain-containing protein [Chitinivorax sp. B]